MLEQLLNCPQRPDHKNYNFLPVSTSYQEELIKVSQKMLAMSKQKQKEIQSTQQFIANEMTENIKNDLILMKLKGFIDQRDITGKSTQIRKLPSKVQVGTIIEGDPIVASKMRLKKKQNSFTDYILKMDQQKQFTRKKFTQLQKLNQRKKKLKRMIIKKKQKSKKK